MSWHGVALLVLLAVAGMGLWLIGGSPGAAVEMAGASAGGTEGPRMLGGLLLGGGLLGLARLGQRTA